MRTKTTSRIVYQKGNSCGDQYAPKNVSGYGTKWKVYLSCDDKKGWGIIGSPKLIESNVSLSENVEKKIENSNYSLNRILGF